MMIKSVSLELSQLNTWWVHPDLIKKDDKIVEFEDQELKHWPDFYHAYSIDKDAILTLRGPRQVGKTTLIKLIIKKLLLVERVRPEAVFYFSLERTADFNELFALVKSYLDFARPRAKERLHIFLDEVTFVDGWVRAIKDLADRGLLKNAVLTLTGSNVLELTGSGERLPGRRGEVFRPDVNFHPLHFGDFVRVIEPKLLEYEPEQLWRTDFPMLEKYLQDYILTGGFIFNINRYYRKSHIPSYAYELFAAWITGDMFKLKRSENFTLRIVEQIPRHLTSRISYSRLAREAGMASPVTAAEYIELLERMFVVMRVPFFSIDQERPDNKKNIKLYFQDPFALASLVAKAEAVLDEAFQFSQKYLQPDFMPGIAELLTGSLLYRYFGDRLFYGMSRGKEIDFVARRGGMWQYFEVKYRRDISAGEIQLPEVLRNRRVTVVTQNSFEKRGLMTLVPLSIFCAYPEKYITLK